MARTRPHLRRLADRLGILSRYRAADGRERWTSDATRQSLVAAMGFDAGTERAAARSLAALDEERRDALIDPVQVIHEPGAFRLRWNGDLPAERSFEFELEIQPEDGADTRALSGVARLDRRGSVSGISLPLLPPGIHELDLVLGAGAARQEARQTLIVAPATCVRVDEQLGRRRVFGIWANLYSLRGRADFGIGHLGDLARLARFAGREGAAFVGVSPLQAARNRGLEVSPYSPLSRLFRNPIYLDPTQFPELSACRTAQQLLASGAFRVELEALRSASRIDHERVAGLLESLFEALHGCFIGMHRDRPTARGRAYARFREREGEQLDRFATFSALEEELARRGYRRDWRAWPAAYRNPDSGALREFRKLHAERVDYHAFLQFELEQQLARAARAGKTAGLELGLYQDLPLGSVASGFDSWAFPELVASGAQLGAPPDRYSASGQDWGLPPLLPRGLAANGYRFWSRVLRTSLSHAGALRLDHAMGLLRQFWIPTGASAEVGAYVRFPFPELAAVLALESHRAHALIVGEDLGSVPRGFQALLARHGILSSRVLFFERRGGGFKPARSYSPRALVTVGTHDTPTLAGFWAERDIEIRRQLGLLDEASLGRAREIRAEERAALLRRLRADGSLRAAAPEPSGAELCAAVHRFVCATPAPLVGLSLDDLAGETEPVNVPGVSSEHYPSWTRRMQTPVNDLSRTPRVRSGLGGARTRAGRRR